MKEKLCTVFLTIAFAFSMIPGTIATQIASEQAVQTTWRIEFEDGLSVQSAVSRQNLEAVANDISEVAFTVDAGKDVFTMGYYFGNEAVSYASILEKASALVDSLNADIASMDFLEGNIQVSLSDLCLRYVAVTDVSDRSAESSFSSVSKLSDVKSKLSGVKTPVALQEEELGGLENPAGTLLLNSINSHYHTFYEADGTNIYWFDGSQNRPCATSGAQPHQGDGNSRYADGYPWYPDVAVVTFTTNVSTGTGYNRTMLQYKYGQSALNNLVFDSNEALEVEVQFYNYDSLGYNESERGRTFQYNNGAVWISSQPGAYLDTSAFDPSYIVSLCVGCPDASQLAANTFYYWRIDSVAGNTVANYPHDGRFRVTTQRSYRNGGSSTWNIFGEEHESTLALGIDNNLNWVPAAQNAWVLAQAGQNWGFSSATDPVRICGN